MNHLNAQLARALGLPKSTTKAVLTLETGEPPRIELDVICTDAKGKPIVETVPGEYGEGLARRLASVRFMVRLEPFKA